MTTGSKSKYNCDRLKASGLELHTPTAFQPKWLTW